jgi:hypothetical protein
MARRFWPGYSWRILAHKQNKNGGKDTHSLDGWWSCSICGWKGQELKTHKKSCPAMKQSTWKNAVPFGTPEWDALRHVHNAVRHSSTVELHSSEIPEPVQFDELVIDDWFHLEQMSQRHYWMRVGNLGINVHIDGDGKATVGTYEDG